MDRSVAIMIYVTGDMHGSVSRFEEKAFDKLRSGDILIICGDLLKRLSMIILEIYVTIQTLPSTLPMNLERRLVRG